MPKRLIIFVVGQMRAAEYTISNFRKNIGDVEGVELVVQCGKADVPIAARTYKSDFTDPWDPSPELPGCLRRAWPLFGNSGLEARRTKPSFYFQLVRQFRAVSQFSKYVNHEDDWILKWRPDLLLLGPLNWQKLTDTKAIWLPYHDNHGGINDQCALGPASLMLPYLSRLRRLDAYFRENGRIHAESFLKWALAGVPVKRVPIPFCIHRGTHLNSVKLSRRLGDVPEDLLARTFNAAGVSVAWGPDAEANSTAKAVTLLVERSWQWVLGQTFSGEELAKTAVSFTTQEE